MIATLALLLSLAAPPAVRVDALFAKVGPRGNPLVRDRSQTRAVLLIHGLGLHPLTGGKANKAALRTWQQADSTLVKELSAHADVYACAYAQAVPVERVAEAVKLAEYVKGLKQAGYTQIVLVGHSAGGLIARHLVEDHPDCGVTKVIQVSSPNAGSALAGLKAANGPQLAFLESLSRAAREATLAKRKDARIPRTVEFAVVVSTLRLGTDGVVTNKSQWTADLQRQGVPAYLLHIAHWDAVKSAKGAELIAKLVRDPQPRWKAEEVGEARKKVLGE